MFIKAKKIYSTFCSDLIWNCVVNHYLTGLAASNGLTWTLTFVRICVVCFIESPLKIMKNVFYFILKGLFVLKIFTF